MQLQEINKSQTHQERDILLDFGAIKNSSEQHFKAIVGAKVYTSKSGFWEHEIIRVLKKAIKKEGLEPPAMPPKTDATAEAVRTVLMKKL